MKRIAGTYAMEQGTLSMENAITQQRAGRAYALRFDGTLYNADELRREAGTQADSDAALLLWGLIEQGADFIKKLNGVFAFAFWDGETLLLARDRLGVKPLYYAQEGGLLRFGSEPKALFALGLTPALDQTSLRELFALGPGHTPGCGIFRGVKELLPAQILRFSPGRMRSETYWQLQSLPHTDSHDDTIERVAWLTVDSVERQMAGDGLCAFLSGGLDSSLVSAISAKKLGEQGKRLHTYSFDFAGNEEFYQENAFQPSRDTPYARAMAAHLGAEHTELTCSSAALADLLDAAMEARDFPGMADVDSSLLYFCSAAGKSSKVALTGECADEVFCGYPWCRSEAAMTQRGFPWSDMQARRTFLREDVLDELDLNSYSLAAYEASVAETPRCSEDSPEEARRREISWLNLRWFMQALLDRMDRCAAVTGIDARVPFADHRLVEYVWNIPWALKYKDECTKYVLRMAGRNWLPEDVLWRRKSPYPKTYNPQYTALLTERMRDLLASPGAPVHAFIDKKKAEEFLQLPANVCKPWYGQLMAAPQRIAWFLQFNAWLEKYF